MRRTFAGVARMGVQSQARMQTAPAWAKPAFVEVFKSDFANMEYPEKAVGGDHLLFSKLMYQLAKSESKEDKYLADFAKLLEKKDTLGPFWRTEIHAAEDKALADIEPGLRFVIRWMQKSAQMDKLEDVGKIFAIYVKAAKKTLVVPITLAGLPESQASQVDAAKKAAQKTVTTHMPDKKDWKLEFEYLVDPGIIDGWRLQVGSMVVEDMSTYLSAVDKALTGAQEVDYTSGPVAKSVPTEWPQNAETEMLADWCEELSLFDAEEARYGA